FYVNRHVINSSLHIGQFNGFFQPQRLSCLPPSQRGRRAENHEYPHSKSPFNASAMSQSLHEQSSAQPVCRPPAVRVHTHGGWLCRRQDHAPFSAPGSPPACGCIFPWPPRIENMCFSERELE